MNHVDLVFSVVSTPLCGVSRIMFGVCVPQMYRHFFFRYYCCGILFLLAPLTRYCIGDSSLLKKFNGASRNLLSTWYNFARCVGCYVWWVWGVFAIDVPTWLDYSGSLSVRPPSIREIQYLCSENDLVGSRVKQTKLKGVGRNFSR